MQWLYKILGVLLCLLIAALATVIHALPIWPFTIAGPAPHPIEALIIALIIGIIVSNTLPFIRIFKSGIDFSAKRILPAAIILLGAQLNLVQVAKISLQALWINITCVIIAFVLTLWLCKLAQINKRLGILIGIGTAICGSTAIVVTAPVIKAQHNETVISITIITLFGLIAVFLFPLIGNALHLNQWAFGVWAGTSIQAIGQVIAASFAYGDAAGTIGTVVKLVRVLLLAPMLLGLSFWQLRQEKLSQAIHAVEKANWTNYLPPFILGFILFVILSSLDVFRDFAIGQYHIATLAVFKSLSTFLLTMAMAGIGLATDIKSFTHTGIKPFVVGFCAAAILAVFSLILILITFRL